MTLWAIFIKSALVGRHLTNQSDLGPFDFAVGPFLRMRLSPIPRIAGILGNRDRDIRMFLQCLRERIVMLIVPGSVPSTVVI